MSIIRKIRESPLHQGEDEQVAYSLTTTPWGSAPGSVRVTLYRVEESSKDRVDVSAAHLVGNASVTGDVITTPLVSGLAFGSMYRIEILFSAGANVFEAWAEIVVEE